MEITPGNCYIARKSWNKYIYIWLDDEDLSRWVIYFPFWGIRWTKGTIPLTEIEKDESLNIKLNLPLDWMEIITKIG